jgi:hypothetical protein
MTVKRTPPKQSINKIVAKKPADLKGPIEVEAELDKKEARSYDIARKGHANVRAELENRELSDKLGQRQLYAKWTFCLVAVWMTLMLVILLIQGFGGFHKNLSEKVLMVAIGSTTVNVLGMLAIILHGLFPNSKK